MNRLGKSPILITVDSLRVGGAEMMLVNLVNRLDRSKFETIVVSLGADNPLSTCIRPDAAQVISIPRRFKYDLRPAHAIRRLILDRCICCVLCFDLFDHFFVRLALTGLRAPRPRVLISMHQTLPENTTDFLKIFVYARFLASDVRIISVCDRQADSLSRTYRIPLKQFQTIYNGVDTGYFDPAQIVESKIEIRQRLGIVPDAFVILQVANFGVAKRHEDSLCALKSLHDCRPELKLILALVGSGRPERKARLKAMIARMRLEGSVLFLGKHQDVRPFYRMADCFTLSSYTESFSVAALEAMAMGLPCVLTDVGGAREMVREGMDGFIVPARQPAKLAEAWAMVSDHSDNWSSDSIRCHVVENFSIEKCVQQYEQLLMESAGIY